VDFWPTGIEIFWETHNDGDDDDDAPIGFEIRDLFLATMLFAMEAAGWLNLFNPKRSARFLSFSAKSFSSLVSGGGGGGGGEGSLCLSRGLYRTEDDSIKFLLDLLGFRERCGLRFASMS